MCVRSHRHGEGQESGVKAPRAEDVHFWLNGEQSAGQGEQDFWSLGTGFGACSFLFPDNSLLAPHQLSSQLLRQLLREVPLTFSILRRPLPVSL